MRITIVTGLTHHGHGGVQRETVQLARSLVSAGTAVAVVSDVPPIADGIRHFPMQYPPGADAGEVVRSAQMEFRPDVVHVMGGGVRLLERIDRTHRHTPGPSRPYAPWMVTVHNVPPFERGSAQLLGNNRWYYRARDLAGLPSHLLWRRFLRAGSFTRAICHSTMVAKRAVAAGCPAAKIVDIPLGHDFAMEASTGAPQPDSNSSPVFPAGAFPRMLSIGGLIHHKGFHDFLEAAARLRQQWPGLHYCVMGETRDWAGYQDFLMQRAKQIGMEERFSLMLNASEAQKTAALQSADLYVQPSHEEGFCLSFLEAAAMVPRVIGTDTGAIAAMADGLHGVTVVPPAQPAALEAAARSLLALRADEDMVERRQSLEARYSWKQHAEQHLALYAAVAARDPAVA